MKLILLRHAKAEWGDGTGDDHDRGLSRRGLDAAPRVGAWLQANGHVPDLILCSTARRTRETTARLGLDDVRCEFFDRLYCASAEVILKLAAERRGGTLLIVSHNPGIAEAAAMAVAEPPSHPDFDRYPTTACTIVSAMSGLPGRVLAFVVPRDLRG